VTGEPKRPDARYILGQSAAETARLMRQAASRATGTRRFLEDAGISSGMRVLDVGSGAGDVALQVGALVGSDGGVVGVDVNPQVLEVVRQRAAEAGLANISFIAGHIGDVTLASDFDAVVGRYVLMYLGAPVEAVRALAGRLRPGGIIAFQEYDFADPPFAYPPSALYQQLRRWTEAASQRAGIERAMGRNLFRTFRAAGLPDPQMRMEAGLGGGPDWSGYEAIVAPLRSMLPQIIEYEIATAAAVDIETFAARLREETVSQQGLLAGALTFSAWSRT